ncbi:MAG TPA: hypothetical protein VHI98_15325 [Vicinamibacterales bacterium]|jgi:hypothetical protein|nr:hypothetical protein [Vicinamibacterales bacterium]
MNGSPREDKPGARDPSRPRHAGPPLGLVAAVYTVLFLAGLYPVTVFGGQPHFPGPWESPDTIAAFFQARPSAVRICAFLQFGAAVPLGIFTASIVSRLQFLGTRVAGVSIALFGGFATAVTMMAASSVLWAMAQPGIAENRAVIQALYWLDLGLGGTGFSVPFGLLVAGVTIPAAFMKLIPKWIVALGIAVAICGELSWLYLMAPGMLPLVPLTRFPGFVWMIAIGFVLPTSMARVSPAAESRGARGT